MLNGKVRWNVLRTVDVLVVYDLFKRESFHGVGNQNVLDEIFGLLLNFYVLGKRIAVHSYFLISLLGIFAVERWFAKKQDEDDDAKCPYIGLERMAVPPR